MDKKTLRKYFSENLLRYSEPYNVLWRNCIVKVVLDSRGSVLNGEYSLLGRNCTTMTIVSLNNGVYPKSWTNNLKTCFLFIKT
ncbi:MAG: hypothetical protein KH846_04810 [Leptotrichia wadei]|uniref:hypothetical protein n=1 Tax=Leptotrichia wadei TaxID=157687 RepID=UPI0026EF7EBC|nr:hypothetical protein [Leptotrichia wadei]MBS6019502.1 hypothetical protein [Leptotrichia wadei]